MWGLRLRRAGMGYGLQLLENIEMRRGWEDENKDIKVPLVHAEDDKYAQLRCSS